MVAGPSEASRWRAGLSWRLPARLSPSRSVLLERLEAVLSHRGVRILVASESGRACECGDEICCERPSNLEELAQGRGICMGSFIERDGEGIDLSGEVSGPANEFRASRAMSVPSPARRASARSRFLKALRPPWLELPSRIDLMEIQRLLAG